MAKKARKAKIGDHILFLRKDQTFLGIVEIVRDNSVIVEISKEAAKELGYETNKTVVKHFNYVVIKDIATA
ncbi:DUF2187 family protein [Bacillus methanolicus]|uniref:DUF2187 domain-containing protein n=1 Tax=Bacillus methanolicus (strain MGA3 / ATCC 53907) TaxID=796606 RepID=I3E8X8_BACMM|nr:DUF2187 family protein [Bacillus methanolicus]AIE60212.1 hypothetical protein BMMGA3_09060 [Bacillus methanolicus MGA3]EIJ82949.1 hypothetical protein MGA3_06975 [Bacillus methanolicus MGA3]UQD52203.1 DUF2187 domain-containing protein [Bacillus methanolicus]